MIAARELLRPPSQPQFHSEPETVLLADEDEEQRTFVARELRREGYNVVEVDDGFELEDYLDLALTEEQVARVPNVIICEMEMAGLSGAEVLADLRKRGLRTPVIWINADESPEVNQSAHCFGVDVILTTPLEMDDLRDAVHLVT